MRASMAPVMVGVLLLAGCGGDDKKTPRQGARSPAVTAPPAASGARPLPARWYADADANGIPDFVERELGRDPEADDCTQNACPLPRGATGAQATRGRATVIALDASGSMAAPAGGGMTKMAAAKRAIRGYVRNTPPALDRFGFVVFGNRGDNSQAGRAASCNGVQTLARVGAFNGAKVARVLSRFKPTGWTPIAAALTEAGRSFGPATKEVARILLVTDGLETCGGDPVAAAKHLQRKGVHVVVDVVGLDIDTAKARRLRAVADATGGRYIDARTTGALLSRFEGLAAEQSRLASQLVCLAAHRDQAAVCRAGMRDAATIAMSSKATGMRADGDEAGASEVDRLVVDLRARSDEDVASQTTEADRRAATLQRQLDRIAKQAAR